MHEEWTEATMMPDYRLTGNPGTPAQSPSPARFSS